MMGMYWPEIQAYSAALTKAGVPLVSNGGPASILCTIPGETQTNLGYLFMTEFFVDSFIVRFDTGLPIVSEDRSSGVVDTNNSL